MTEISLQDSLNNKETELELGAKLSGRYQIKGVLGEGAASVVYRALDQYLGSDVALKILRAECGEDSATRERFLREAKALGSLSHPNIVKILASGIDEKQGPFLAMDLLEGCSLASLLKEKTCLSLGEFKAVFSQILNGLSYVHEHGIIHRDIKPENIIVDLSTGHIKASLIDFNIARMEQSEQSAGNLTKTGIILGTPAYMSPEQCLGQKATSASDVYSLACVMYQSLCGRLPFTAESSLELLQKHISEEPEKIAKYAADELSRKLGSVIDAALVKDRSMRTESASSFKSQLEPCWQGFSEDEPKVFSKILKRKSNHRNHIILGVLLIGLLGGIALYSKYMSAENFVKISENKSEQGNRAFQIALRQKQRALLRAQSWQEVSPVEARYDRAQEYFYCLRDLALVYLEYKHFQEGKEPLLNANKFVENLQPQIRRSMHVLCLGDLANLYMELRDLDNAARTLAELKKLRPLNTREESKLESYEARFLIASHRFGDAAEHLKKAIDMMDDYSSKLARQDGFDVSARKLAESSSRGTGLVYLAMLECTRNLPRNLQTEQSSYLRLAKLILEFHQTNKNAMVNRKLFIRYVKSVQNELGKLEAVNVDKSLCEAIRELVQKVS